MNPESILDQYLTRYSPDVFQAFLNRLSTELNLLANPSRPIPMSRVPLLLEERYLHQFQRAVTLIWDVLHRTAYQEITARNIPRELRIENDETRSIPFDSSSNIGCVDFHLHQGKLKVIEFMALPPGMAAIYPGLLARYGEFLADMIPGFGPVSFAEGWTRERCEGLMIDQIRGKATAGIVAIIDWNPTAQITYGEFLYLQQLIEKTAHGLTCLIADPREVALRGNTPWIRGLPVDRILNRVTLVDWMHNLEKIPDYSRLLWEYPEVFVYHPYLWYLADKASLILVSDPETVSLLGFPKNLVQELTELVPLTRALSDFNDPQTGRLRVPSLIEHFGSPDAMVLKPVSSHASKGVLYGPLDFPSEEKLAENLLAIDPAEYVVMKRIPPGETPYPTGEGKSETWRYDLRAYVFNDRMLFAGGRVYLGAYTNQLPTREFAPLFFVS